MARGHRSRKRLKVATMLLGAIAAMWAVSIAAVLSYARRDRATRADAIVVLGAAQYAGRPSPVLKARLDHAVSLYRTGMAPTLVLTGGIGDGDTTSEAAVSRRYVMRKGVPEAAIVTEDEGRTTRESVAAVAGWMRAHDDSTAIFVSDPFHMLRLTVLARRHGLVPLPSPTRTSPISESAREEWKYVLSESVKVPYAMLFERRVEQ
ncbi:MAG TPA: YdcF family protein [Gemmatimonadaceae bacterium]|nr:YdcF family protein [Gemmatimonadaceae bacterium]